MVKHWIFLFRNEQRMKYLLSLALCLCVIFAEAQPTNNDCNGVIDLGVAPLCPPTIFSNIGATPYDIDFENTPPCFNNTPENDVWFSFQTDAMITDYRFTISGTSDDGNNALSNIQVGLYRGFCIPNGLSLSGCGISGMGDNELIFEVTDSKRNLLCPHRQFRRGCS